MIYSFTEDFSLLPSTQFLLIGDQTSNFIFFLQKIYLTFVRIRYIFAIQLFYRKFMVGFCEFVSAKNYEIGRVLNVASSMMEYFLQRNVRNSLLKLMAVSACIRYRINRFNASCCCQVYIILVL